jgi:hypothetical protein
MRMRHMVKAHGHSLIKDVPLTGKNELLVDLPVESLPTPLKRNNSAQTLLPRQSLTERDQSVPTPLRRKNTYA